MTRPTDTPPRPDRSVRRRLLVGGGGLAVVVVAIGLWLTQPWLLFVDVVASESLPAAVADTSIAGAEEGTDVRTDAGDAGGPQDGAVAGVASEVDRGTDEGPADEPAGAPDAAARDTEVAGGAPTPARPDAARADDDSTDATAGTAPSDDGEPGPRGPRALATGSFVDRDHPTSGTATIVELPDGSRVLTIEGLDTDNGPDLFVHLDDDRADAPEGDFDDGTSLGRLRANRGDLVYEIPDDLDLGAIASVAIWCDRFSSLFGAADLVPVP